MVLQCLITRKCVKDTLSVSTNPLRQILHISRRDLIFNYALGAVSSGPTNQCAGKQASSYKIKNVLYGSSYLSNTQKHSDFQYSNDQLTKLKIQGSSFFKGLRVFNSHSSSIPRQGGGGGMPCFNPLDEFYLSSSGSVIFQLTGA